MLETRHFHDEAALLDRLSKGLKRRSQEVVFLVGAPLSAPLEPSLLGVPGVDGVIDLIRREFWDSPEDLLALESDIKSSGLSKYQAAFRFLQGRRGQHAANEIVQTAVLAARIPEAGTQAGQTPVSQGKPPLTDEACRFLESDFRGWALNPGSLNIGKLATSYPERFGKSILTTNFDPLLEMSIRVAGGTYFKTTLHADGSFSHTDGMGSYVIHLHGYWYGADTLHTSQQLGQSRPHLKDSLRAYLRDKLLVVSGYGGWDDSFTSALMQVVSDDTAFPDILWTFHALSPQVDQLLWERILPGIDRGRVTLYGGIDCNVFFPKLFEKWLILESPAQAGATARSNPVAVDHQLVAQLHARSTSSSKPDEYAILEGDEQDRPPFVELCVGRDLELEQIRDAAAKLIFITGIGGQGKSTLAARYFEDCRKSGDRFSVYVWRDCKEESERFENQLCSVIETMTNGHVSREDLAKRDAREITEILLTLIKDRAVLFVFDNIDHYVNRETERMMASPDVFIEAMLKSGSPSRALFTCRSSVQYGSELAMSCPLQGITLSAASELFTRRGASSLPDEIEDAHRLTEGHAFWLDLLAIQVAKRSPAVELSALVNKIRSGGGPLPEKTLTSVWATLHDREKMVLHALAEAVKPETQLQIADYLSHEITYNKVDKAINALRSLNLLVVKLRPEAPDLLELHPLVRTFIRKAFPLQARLSFIKAIIAFYRKFIRAHQKELTQRPTFSVLELWTQNAELDLAAGLVGDAILRLAEVAPAFTSSSYPREFTRVARMLLSQTRWIEDHGQFKGFETVFTHNLHYLAHLGNTIEVDRLLGDYSRTVTEKDARYINYCDLQCYCKWIRGDFEDAVMWGKTGLKLQKLSKVATNYNVQHSLALAERDAGRPEEALTVFLKGCTLADAVNPKELDDQRDGSFYGNIGRCLQFMGQIESALTCYQKSALLLEKNPQYEHVMNQGYIRAWIGEALVAREQFGLAYVFLRAAAMKWNQASPPRATAVARLAQQIKGKLPQTSGIADNDLESVCLEWIMGQNVDTRFR